MALKEGDLKNTILKNISIDEFEPKTGESKDVMVVGLYLNETAPAKDLYHFINNSVIEIRDVEVSPNPNPDNYYMVFMEIDRKEDCMESVRALIEEVERLTGGLDWQVSTTLSEDKIGLKDDNLMQYIQCDPENYLTKEEFMAQQLEAEERAEEQRLEEEAKDNSNKILEFFKPSNILEAGINDNVLHIRGSRDVASFEIVNFGHGPDIMSEMGISESAIKQDYDRISFAKLNAMLGEMKALPIDEYIVMYNPAHKDILIAKAS
jgi:hypothetical protein|tara:strand:+ start:567 stop:1358 length:792 start_codon:yes stop_codon:yes gene_type:complete